MAKPLQVEDYAFDHQPVADGPRSYYDETLKRTIVKVLPGTQYISSGDGELITTILGSCVSACVWDPYLGRGGMNHFMLPFDQTGDWSGKSSTLRYGNHAMLELVNGLVEVGANRYRLINKMFGGANVLAGAGDVGERNTRFSQDYIEKRHIMTVQADLGGERGRRIVFDPETGRVWRKFLSPNSQELSALPEIGAHQKLKSRLESVKRT